MTAEMPEGFMTTNPNQGVKSWRDMKGYSGMVGDTPAITTMPYNAKAAKSDPLSVDVVTGINVVAAGVLAIFVLTISMLSVPQ